MKETYIESIVFKREESSEWEKGYYIGDTDNSSRSIIVDKNYSPLAKDEGGSSCWDYRTDIDNWLTIRVQEDFKMKIVKLRVCHYPQIPCDPFIVEVESLEEARMIKSTLGNYDLFQYENKIKPDYSNMSTVEQWDEDEQEWYDWEDEETGISDIDEYFEFVEDEE